jgi:hypothetical protein
MTFQPSRIKEVIKTVGNNLVYNTIPGKPGIIDNNVNLAPAEVSRLLDQIVNVRCVSDVASHGDGSAGRSVVDFLRDSVCFFYTSSVIFLS